MGLRPLDKAKVEAFAQKMMGGLNNAALALMISIGHRTGLFDTMSEMSAAQSEQIARKAGLQERYVREWLGAMVTGRIVEYDPRNGTYHLPPEHAASLTRAAPADNIAAFTQYIGLMGTVEDRVVECFKKGGGVPYSEFGRFHEVMAEDSGQSVLPALLDHILPLVPDLKDRLTNGVDVLDVGCGRGRALNLMAGNFPKSRFTGYDISGEAIATARAEAGESGLANVSFKVEDVTEFGPEASYDLITAFDAIHDQARPDKVLKSIAGTLRPDGVFLMQDIAASSHVHENLDHPMGSFLYCISCMHCMTVSLAQGGMGLGTMWGREKAQEMLREVGFTRVRIENLPHDVQNHYYIATKAR
jgi:2-polyprenyl-3-methyl-5-hydroxy-6-metoxy-1,4-benzoquinol methylase